MKKTFFAPFRFIAHRWYLPLIIMVLGFVVSDFLLKQSMAHNKEWLYTSALCLLVFSVCQMVAFTIYNFYKRKFKVGIWQLLFTLIFGGAGFVYFMILISLFPNDFYADDLIIPNNITFSKPMTSYECNFDCTENEKIHLTSPTFKNVSNPDFYIFDGIQGGIYTYDVYIGKIEKGEVYLKAFEITHNDPLSIQSLALDSKIAVENPSQTIQKFSLNGDFTIYEGDWDKYYGSRFELWFRPADKTKPERLLMTKNYIIQGWMR